MNGISIYDLIEKRNKLSKDDPAGENALELKGGFKLQLKNDFDEQDYFQKIENDFASEADTILETLKLSHLKVASQKNTELK